jgi:CelD/BcsL family acetyltransferase involved in cellulose biosynthesis
LRVAPQLPGGPVSERLPPSLLSAWPPLPPHAWAHRPRTSLPFPLDDPGYRLFARARHGLYHGLQSLGLGPGAEVLVPAWHHGSEVEALSRAGVACRFYDCGDDLAPDAAALEDLLGPAVRGLYLIHYLGFPQDSRAWRQWCDDRGLLLLEDAAQGWLGHDRGRPLGSFGDLAILCLDKTFGLPDGGALVLRGGAPAVAGNGSHPGGVATTARRHAAWLAGRLPATSALLGDAEGHYDPAGDFALGDARAGVSRATRALLPRLADPAVAAARRARYRLMLAELGDAVPAPFGVLPDGCSPFVFPIHAGADKAALMDRLRRGGIKPLDLWSVPHPALDPSRFPGAAARRGRTIGLPVHQELRHADVERIVTAVRGGRRRAEPRLERADSLAELRSQWRSLAERVGSPFATWEWAETWWRHFGGGRPLHLTTCRAPDGRLVAILPLYAFADRPMRVLRFIGHGPADRLEPLCAPGDRAVAAAALRRSLALHRADVLIGDRLPGQDEWGALLGATQLRREASPLLHIGGRSWDELLAARSANFRQQARRRERRLREAHRVTIRLADDPQRLDADFATLVALHEARWAGGGSEAFVGARRPFHEAFAFVAQREGWLRLWLLELDGRPAAAWYGFRFGGAEWFYQAGRDPAYDHLSVGFVLMAHALREAAADGVGEFQLLRGDDPYKGRFASDDYGLETIALGRGPLGRAAAAAGVSLQRRSDRVALRD